MNELAIFVLSAFISIIVAYITAKAAGYSKDVVEERKEWREKIREITIEAVLLMQDGEVHSSKFLEIFGEFRVRLNPDDKDDNAILETLRRSMNAPDVLLSEKLLAQTARLLKHDWERAKAESRPLGFLNKPNSANIRMLKSDDYLDTPSKEIT